MENKTLQQTLLEEFGRNTIKNAVLPAYFQTSLSRTLRPYQEECFRYFTTFIGNVYDGKPRRPHLLFHMATGSGKTLIMAGAMLYLYEQGYRNFLFFVDSTNIVEKTRDNFLNPASDKYLFSDKIEINGKQITLQQVDNFQSANPDCINFCLTTIQALHTTLNTPRENGITIDDFAEQPIILIADEAHHINKETREGHQQTTLNFNEGEQNEETTNWEQTVMRIFQSNEKNMLLEFTATADLTNPYIAEKYSDKIIFDYPLREFRKDGYSKDIEVIEADLSPIDRALQAVVLSQFKRKLFASRGLNCKPVVMFKSKTKAENKAFFATFADAIAHLDETKLQYLRGIAKEGDMQRAYQYFEAWHISDENLALELKEDFSEERLLIVDTNNISPEKQQYLNSLEAQDNAYRAVFAVDMLNEGWDVLNLYDIVRLYDTRDANNNRPGKTTMQEAQLIGRGARYYAFHDENLPERDGMRKYDNDILNPLRTIEKLHYHSQHNPRYIQELHTALVSTGIIEDKVIEVEHKLKESFKQSQLYLHGKIFKNEQRKIEPQEKNKDGLSKQILNKTFLVEMPTGKQRSGDLFGRYSAAEFTAPSIAFWSFGDLGYNVTRTAINSFAELHFDRLQHLFPALKSVKEFMESEKYLRFIKIEVHGATEEVEQGKMSQQNKLYVAKQVLRQIIPLLQTQEKEYIGTAEFKPFEVQKIFTDKVLRFDKDSTKQVGKSMNDPFNTGYHLNLSQKDWYAYTDCFGTGEEKELVKYIDRVYQQLSDKYEAGVWLVRNELDFKIYDFDKGRPFAPDFVLFLRRRSAEGEALFDNLQIFIEPKGQHLIANDKWKEDFLNVIHAGGNICFQMQGEQFNIYGLPFFNTDANHPEQLENFKTHFREIVGFENMNLL